MKYFLKFLAFIISVSMLVMITSCGETNPGNNCLYPVQNNIATINSKSADRPYIAIISKGFQHQFWQIVMTGSKDAAARYNADLTFDGPPSESDIDIQVEMLKAAMAKNPSAIALAALDTQSVMPYLNELKEKHIPVIGFDSGIPDAPEGTILATVSTNNENAGQLAADSMFANSSFQVALSKATPENPVVIAVASQDVTSASIVGRTVGFVNQMRASCEKLFPDRVAVTGHGKYAKSSIKEMAVEIFVIIPDSSSPVDSEAAIKQVLNKKGLISIFVTNESTVEGILAATNEGADLDRENGKYKNITVVGFDAGSAHKTAVKNGWFLGSITQDSYMIGYLAVELAYKAYKGEPVADCDTRYLFYNADNMDQPDIEQFLYD